MSQQTAEFVEEKDEPEDDTIAASIDAAWAQHEAGIDDGGDTEADSAPDTESGSEERTEGAQPAQDAQTEEVEGVKPKADEKDGGKPPAGLSAAAREAWKTAPKELKDEFSKREKDYSVGLQKNAEWAKRAQQMDTVLQPFQQYLAMNGGAQAIPNLLTTASTLQMGSPRQRAEAAAEIINQFGVDINMLDELLSGQAPAQAQKQMSPIEQRMQDFLDQQERVQHNSLRQQQEQVNQSVSQFIETHEFAGELAEEMADQLEQAARRGQPMTMEQAHDRAMLLRPDLTAIVNGRKSTQSVNKRRNAASSIQGSPSGASGRSEASDLRGAIEAAFEQQGQV